MGTGLLMLGVGVLGLVMWWSTQSGRVKPNAAVSPKLAQVQLWAYLLDGIVFTVLGVATLIGSL